MKSHPGPPMTLGSAAKAHLTLIAWCKGCWHQAESDLADAAERYGAETPIREWTKRLVCGQCGSRNVDSVMMS
jgi:hypothetical protein